MGTILSVTLHGDTCTDIQFLNNEVFHSLIFQMSWTCSKGNREILRTVLPKLSKMMKLAVTVLVTLCTSEKSFSSIRHMKTY